MFLELCCRLSCGLSVEVRGKGLWLKLDEKWVQVHFLPIGLDSVAFNSPNCPCSPGQMNDIAVSPVNHYDSSQSWEKGS